MKECLERKSVSRSRQNAIVDSLVQPICICTLIVSIGPYVTDHYFAITIVTLIMVVLVLRWNEQRTLKRVLEEQYFTRQIGQTTIVRNKDVGLPGKSQEDLVRFSRLSFDNTNNNDEKSKKMKRTSIAKLKGHRLFKTMN